MEVYKTEIIVEIIVIMSQLKESILTVFPENAWQKSNGTPQHGKRGRSKKRAILLFNTQVTNQDADQPVGKKPRMT